MKGYRPVFARRGGATAAFLGALLSSALFGASGCGKREPAPAPSPSPSPQQAPGAMTFRNVAPEMGIDFKLGHGGRSPLNILDTIGHGGALFDYDRDGRLDVLLLGPDQVRLYRNTGARFEEVTAATGVSRPGYWIGATAGDFDRDGWPDLCLSGYHCRALLRNRRGAGFVDVTRDVGLGSETGWGTSVGMVDLDRDGYLDLFFCRYADFGKHSQQFCNEDGLEVMCAPRSYPPEKPQAFRNDAGRAFTDQTKRWGFDRSSGRGLALLPADLNEDGWTDLVVANDTEPTDLFISEQGRHFRNDALRAGVAVTDSGRPLAGMGLDAQDFDQDGRLDLFISTFEGEPKCIWRSVDKSRFEDVSNNLGTDGMREWLTWGIGLEDFDNDGQLDLHYVNGHVFDRRSDPNFRMPQPMRLYGGVDGRFEDQTASLPGDIQQPIVGRASAYGDWDNDGLVDILVTNLEGSALLLHNETRNAHRWAGVRVTGKNGGPSLGAQVRLEAGGKSWIKEVRAVRSVYASSDPRLHFGLGDASAIDKITVRWPSGRRTEHGPFPTGKQIDLKEP